MTRLSAPITTTERITNLDTVRGIATLGILLMNVVSFGLPVGAYLNLDLAGSNSTADWVVGVLGEIFIDQKTMGLFSMLFGAGIVVFADRAEAKGRRPVLLSLWRNLLLLGIGLVHTAFWDGDVLTVYAICAPLLLMLRNRSARALFILGGAAMAASALSLALAQRSIDGTVADLGWIWFDVDNDPVDAALIPFIGDAFLRALGMMLIGVGLYRAGIMHGTKPAAFYRRMVVWGFAIGLPLTTAGVIAVAARDFDGDVALIGMVPNTAATIPIALGYLGLISLWNQRPDTPRHEIVRSVGRMALTNYLTQTALGLLVLRVVFDFGTLGRSQLLVFVVVVWLLQLAWSKPWLDRFRFGPLEWLWRMVTYRSWQPLRR